MGNQNQNGPTSKDCLRNRRGELGNIFRAQEEDWYSNTMSRDGGGGCWRVEVMTSPPDFSVDSLGGVGSLADEVQKCWPEGGKEGGA